MSVSYETRKGTCIFHGPVFAFYHRHPLSLAVCVSVFVGRKRGALDVFVFVCDRDRELCICLPVCMWCASVCVGVCARV